MPRTTAILVSKVSIKHDAGTIRSSSYSGEGGRKWGTLIAPSVQNAATIFHHDLGVVEADRTFDVTSTHLLCTLKHLDTTL